MTWVYHQCGNPLWLEGHRYGDVYLAKLFDGREEGRGQYVKHCPTYGEDLACAIMKRM